MNHTSHRASLLSDAVLGLHSHGVKTDTLIKTSDKTTIKTTSHLRIPTLITFHIYLFIACIYSTFHTEQQLKLLPELIPKKLEQEKVKEETSGRATEERFLFYDEQAIPTCIEHNCPRNEDNLTN